MAEQEQTTRHEFRLRKMNRRHFLKATGLTTAPLVFPWMRGEAMAGADSASNANKGSFSFVTIPDVHVDFMCSKQNLSAMAKWIVEHVGERNIRFVCQLGDIGDRRGSGPILEMLQQAREAMAPLVEADIPLTVCVGNHDYDDQQKSRSLEHWSRADTFGPDLYRGRPWFGGTFEDHAQQPGLHPGGAANHYMRLELPGARLLLLNLEFGPRDKVMQWAEDLVSRQYPDHDVIVFTHSYLHTSGERVTKDTRWSPKGYGAVSTEAGPEYTNDGQDLWERYFRRWPKLRMVHSGHAIWDPRQARLISEGDHGNPVTQLFNNWQSYGFDPDEGKLVRGQPYQATMLRIFSVNPRANTVTVENLMPVIDKEGEAPIPASFDYAQPW